jgi:chemotaxis protein histidine kinase CheA/CheY-like chemotaxis protein
MASFDISQLQADDEAKLKQELSELFAADTQVSLQTYLKIAQQLNASTWKADSQELYRAIHTIKGGAVTVGAESLLPMAIALENILSDLRYLEEPPVLSDNHLSATLLEAGELLASTSQIKGEKKEVLLQIQPALTRIREIHTHIKETYCPQGSEETHIWQDFSNYGFDLIVLNLEVALAPLEHEPIVPLATKQIAEEVLVQLYEVGQELSLASGWQSLLTCAQTLLDEPRSAEWRTHWPTLLRLLKQCAKQGGVLGISLDAVRSLGRSVEATSAPPSRRQLGLFPDSYKVEVPQQVDVGAFLDNLGALETFAQLPLASKATDVPLNDLLIDDPAADRATVAASGNSTSDDGTSDRTLKRPVEKTSVFAADETVQIPVALSRLDHLSQDIVDSLLAARGIKNYAQNLQPLITRLVALSQESRQYIEPLKQLRADPKGNFVGGSSELAITSPPRPPIALSDRGIQQSQQSYTAVNRLLETTSRFAEIGAEVETVLRQTNQSVRTLESSLLNLQRTVEESRLVSFRTLIFRAKTILRDLTVRYGKSVHIEVEGDPVDLDVGSARSLEPVLLHLIRNAYAHGIESAAERKAQGKPAEGTIGLSLHRRGDTYLLELSDDGQGIRTQAVEAKAAMLGLPLTQAHSAEQLLAIICQPGFSLETRINEISGRGVGMDVVANQVAQMGGKLTLETQPQQGTTFRLSFSAPRLLISCILIRAGEHTFALPAEEVCAIALFETLNTLETTELGWLVDTNTQTETQSEQQSEKQPLTSVLKYWQSNSPVSTAATVKAPTVTPTATDVCLCVTAPVASAFSTSEFLSSERSRKLWLQADEIVDSSELLVQSLPSPLSTPEGIIGISVQPDGTLIPVLEGPIVAQKLLNQIYCPEKTAAETSSGLSPDLVASLPSEKAADYILIVDDAALMRRRIEMSLQGQNYRTHTCADGLEAWNWLQSNSPPRLMITDIDMPRLNGFSLIERCRQAGMRLPIMVVSSRLSEEWSDEAKRLGASDYLNKGFANFELIHRVEALLGVTGDL